MESRDGNVSRPTTLVSVTLYQLYTLWKNKASYCYYYEEILNGLPWNFVQTRPPGDDFFNKTSQQLLDYCFLKQAIYWNLVQIPIAPNPDVFGWLCPDSSCSTTSRQVFSFPGHDKARPVDWKIVFYHFMDKNCSHQGERRNELPEQKTTADCFNRAGNHSNNHHSR